MKIGNYEVKGIKQTNSDYNHNKHLPYKKIMVVVDRDKKLSSFGVTVF